MSTAELEKKDSFAAILYAEPGTLGLIANIMSALVVAVENMMDGNESRVALSLAGVHLIVIGGFLQLVAGFMSYRRNDHLTGSAFIVFSTLWTVHGVTHFLMTSLPLDLVQRGVLPGMIGFMAIAVVLCVCAATVNYIMPPVLIAILLTLIFEGVGLFFQWGRRVAAGFELFIALSGIYGVVVMTLKGVSQRYVLPGFGNAPYDLLLIRSRARDRGKTERRKNTKYAEPMGMGYLGNVVPAVVFAFHHLGYFSDFRPAIPMLLNTLFCQLFASYYAFLRHDFFHATQFVVYLVFWTAKAVFELLVSMDFPAIESLRVNFFGLWGILVAMLVLLVCSTCQSRLVFLYNLLFVTMMLLSLEHIPRGVYNYTFGISCVITAVASLYISMAHLVNSIAEKTVMYTGPEMASHDSLRTTFERLTACSREPNSKVRYVDEGPHLDEQIADTVCFMGNAVACLSLSPLEATNGTESLPWLLVAGGLVQLYVARLAYASGSLAKTYLAVVYAIYWTAWSALLFDAQLAISLRATAIAVLCLHTTAMLLTPVFNRIWIPFSLFMELTFISFVVRCFGVEPSSMVLVTSLLAGLVALYGTFAGLINGVLLGAVVPLGEPLLTERQLVEESKKLCPTFTSRRTSALREAAKIIDQGGVVGIPTDTVYALAASCKHPQSIKNVYHIKGRPVEKPICVCLSNLDQLVKAKPNFSPLLWAFMRKCYPGGISCVVPKGQWLMNLGLDEATNYIGTKDSVCIRVPDSSVLSYLIGLTGPVALTSANPSGGSDSTHHDMVLHSLGHKIDGLVCDGSSNELVASTVVNCLKIDEDEISFIRAGCVPQEKVQYLFEEAKAQVDSSSFSVDLDGRPNQLAKF